MKIDVEGAEFRILPRLADVIAESRCTWYVSFHEWNLNPAGLPAEPYRAAELIHTISAFASLNWYTHDLTPLDKTAVLDSIIARQWPLHASLVFTNRVIAD